MDNPPSALEALDQEKRQLEIQKLRTEIKASEKPAWKKQVEFLASLFQSFAVIIGVVITLNEFVFKSSERKIQQKKSTIDFLEKKESDTRIRAGYDYLNSLYPVIHDIRMVESDSFRERMIGLIDDSIVNKTRAMTNFWNVIYNGVNANLFSADYCRIVLREDNAQAIEMLWDIQNELWRNRDNTFAKEYAEQFAGLIEYYRQINAQALKTRGALNPTYHGDKYPMPTYDKAK